VEKGGGNHGGVFRKNYLSSRATSTSTGFVGAASFGFLKPPHLTLKHEHPQGVPSGAVRVRRNEQAHAVAQQALL